MSAWYWTPDRLARLRALYERGLTARELEREFPGSSAGAIRKAASRAGIRWGGPRVSSDELRDGSR